jgi:predicted ArsR family transcriptional regulator
MGNDLKERGESGEWTAVISDQEILEAVAEYEPARTNEVADEIGMSRQGTDRRLKIMLNDGETERLQRKKVGASVVWYLND